MRKAFYLCISVLALLFVIPSASPAVDPPAVGQSVPELELPVPKESAERSYLGISGRFPLVGGGTFKPQQVKAQAVILQVFSMYCPHCQKDAPNMNAFYNLIEASPKAKGKVKIIGVGAGNNPYEVAVFKKKYQVPFPLLPDGDYTAHKKLAEVRTPYFIVLRIMPDGTGRVVYSKLGSFGDPAVFLDSVLKMTGI